jgi:phage terminase Nu1 subunit (DNA packaging protein)
MDGIIIGTMKLARILKCDVRTVYRYCEIGMPYTQISKNKRAYNLDQIKAWLSSNKK